jgi:tetratricopeptide (TPR) repeat protein
LDSTIFETQYNLGIAYTQAEKYPEAVETFKKAIELKPDFADTYYSLAVAQENYAKGIIDGSIKDKEDNSDKPEVKDLDEAKPVKLTKEDKAQIVELLDNSINSYRTYLENGQELKDKAEVDSKIEYLFGQKDKYANEISKPAE